MRRDSVVLEIQLLASLGHGWEDIFVKLLGDGKLQQKNRPALRRYVLCLSRRRVAA